MKLDLRSTYYSGQQDKLEGRAQILSVVNIAAALLFAERPFEQKHVDIKLFLSAVQMKLYGHT